MRRSEFAGVADYRRCASHSRWFWAFRPYLSMAQHGATFLRPDRKNEPHRNGSLGAVRRSRIGLRLLALAAGIWHKNDTAQPGRAFAAYGR